MLSFLPFKKVHVPKSTYTVGTDAQVENLPAIFEHVFGYKTNGTFVEVGAMDGQDHSNTCGLADIGWKGLYIEATEHYANLCKQRHAKNTNTRVLRLAISDHVGTLRLRKANALTTAEPLFEKAYSEMEWSQSSLHDDYEEVPCKTLNQVCIENNIPRGFDVLVIDVEGHELQVLKGFSLNIWKPKMIIIEIQDDHPDFQQLPNAHEFMKMFREIRHSIESAGYKLLYKNTINSVYVL